MAAKRKPAKGASRRKPKTKRARKRAGFQLRLPSPPAVELIGVALIAAGSYLGFMYYLGWDGGRVGEWVREGLDFAIGDGAYIVTLLLLLCGVLAVTGTSAGTAAGIAGRGLARSWRFTAWLTRPLRRRLVRAYLARPAHEPTAFELPDTQPLREADPNQAYGVAEDPPFEEPEPELELEADDQLAFEPPPEPESAEIAVARTPMGNRRGVTQSDEVDYTLPSPRLLMRGGPEQAPDTAGQQAIGQRLIETLGHFGVAAQVLGIVTGPHVSRYEIRLAPGTKVAKVAQLKDDLAYALASTDIRILAPIPGKQAVGVEIPNLKRRVVTLGDVYQARPAGASPLTAWLGKDIAGNAVWTDLSRMPHLLVAGTTGSGKSGSVNAMLSSILLHSSPNEVRLVLVDPKQVELNHYEAVPHLLTPVVTAPRLAANVLGNLIVEMESRYGVMGEARCRNLAELNRSRVKSGEAPLPYILCVIDELADLMMVAPAEVEDYIIRLAQKSRAVGIHLVLATQRPSTDVITGTIKVNIPARIAFAVSSQVDSRVILDQGGAETLLGQGDMLFRPVGTSKLQRIQGAFITEDEIARITGHWASQGEPEFADQLLEARAETATEEDEGEFPPDQDDLLEEAISIVAQTQTASVSMIQRRLRVGYTRAGRLIDMLERRGIISGYEGSKPRQVLISEADLSRVLAAVHTSGSEAKELEPATASHEL